MGGLAKAPASNLHSSEIPDSLRVAPPEVTSAVGSLEGERVRALLVPLVEAEAVGARSSPMMPRLQGESDQPPGLS